MKNQITLEGLVANRKVGVYGPMSNPFVFFHIEFEASSGKKGVLKVVAAKSICPKNISPGIQLTAAGQLENSLFEKDGKPMSAYQIVASRIDIQSVYSASRK